MKEQDDMLIRWQASLTLLKTLFDIKYTDCRRLIGDGLAFDPLQAVGIGGRASAAVGDEVTELVTCDL